MLYFELCLKDGKSVSPEKMQLIKINLLNNKIHYGEL